MKLAIPWHRFPPFESEKVGGLTVSMWGMTKEMAKQGVDFDVLVPSEPQPSNPESVGGVNVIKSALGTKLAGNARMSAQEERQILDYDRVLSIQGIGSRPLSVGLVKSRVIRQLHNVLTNMPVSFSLTLRPNPLEYSRSFFAIRRQSSAERRLSGVPTMCVSQHLLNLAEEYRLELHENLHRVPNGVDTGAFRQEKAEKTLDLLFVGGFYRVKGIDLLLESLSMLHQGGNQLRLAIVGAFTPGQRAFLLNSVPTRVRDHISFLGVVSHESMPEKYRAARLVVVPSRYETFGLVALEAMACGVPVVSSNVGGLPELVDSSVGKLVQPNDGKSLAKAIIGAWHDYALLKSSEAKGPLRASRYEWKVVVSESMDVIRGGR